MNEHNKKILQSKHIELKQICNHLLEEGCPRKGLWLSSNILYQATVKCNKIKYKLKGPVKQHSRKIMLTAKIRDLINHGNNATFSMKY